MKRKKVLLAAALAGVAALCGCRTPMEKYEKSLIAGDYTNATLIATDEIRDGDRDDELMWRLMAGGASRLAGDGSAAIQHFDRAEDIMIDHDGTSVFAKGATGTWAMMTNDKAFPYDGGGQDRIMTCLYKAIDFAAAGRPDAARTEFNRAAQHQENWLYERRGEIAAAEERMNKDVGTYKKEKQSGTLAKGSSIDSGKVVDGAFANATFAAKVRKESGFDMAKDGILDNLQPVDWMNPYAAHVTGVFRRLNGDACRNYLKDALTCNRENPTLARDFAEVEQGEGVKPQNQVWIWLEEGLCPKREEWRIDLPLVLIPHVNKYVMYAGMALPRQVARPSAGSGWKVGSAPMAELVDMDAKVKIDFDVYFRAALIREITRTAVKIGTQVAMGVVAENLSDWRTKYALKASQIAVAAWAASTTGADTRSWTSLPKKVHVVRIDRPADGKIVLSGNGGTVAELTVPNGNSMVFVSKPSAGAAASAKVVTYP